MNLTLLMGVTQSFFSGNNFTKLSPFKFEKLKEN